MIGFDDTRYAQINLGKIFDGADVGHRFHFGCTDGGCLNGLGFDGRLCFSLFRWFLYLGFGFVGIRQQYVELLFAIHASHQMFELRDRTFA